MYKIIGADGKEYGPVSLEQLKDWRQQGRIGAQSRILDLATNEWKTAAELPGLQEAFSAGPVPVFAPGGSSGLRAEDLPKGLSVTSLVLGILSLICLGPFAGIPAVICGHIARNKAQRNPPEHGGAGLALAGLILGYVGIALTFLLLPAMLLPALAKAKGRAQSINCVNNMKQIGLAFKIWEVDHNDTLPFHTGSTNGGTMELVGKAAQGTPDPNGFQHFRILANELSVTKILICPGDTGKQPAASFTVIGPNNVSYLLYTDESVKSSNPSAVLAECPVHNHKLLVDGSVQSGSKYGRR